MVKRSAESLLRQYDEHKTLAEDLAPRLEKLLSDLLSSVEIRPHSVSARVKSRDSLARKCVARNPPYATLDEITDIIGLRVITYFYDEVDTVASIVETNFDVDPGASVDKRSQLEPDRFGYLSLYFVAELSPARLQLPEWSRFANAKFEIQIRSILQHAWAEIEHDLGYKSTIAVPRPLRRRFSRLAGLLEVADDEFARLRVDLETYAREAKAAVASDLHSLSVDQASLLEYVTQNPRVRDLDRQIAVAGRQHLDPPDPQYAATLAASLSSIAMNTLAEVGKSLEDHASLILRFAGPWAAVWEAEEIKKSVPAGLSLYYLYLLIVAESGRSQEQLGTAFRLDSSALGKLRRAYSQAKGGNSQDAVRSAAAKAQPVSGSSPD